MTPKPTRSTTSRAKTKTPTTAANKTQLARLTAQVAAIRIARAVVEFSLDGIIVDANEIFCAMAGRRPDALIGRHHHILVDEATRHSAEYRTFWETLAGGEAVSGHFRYVTGGGEELWIQGNYNPSLDATGQPFAVFLYGTDITELKLRSADFEGQRNAVSKAQAIVEFTLDGKILSANENFCMTFGYPLEEIRGQHHSMLVDNETRMSNEYRTFWDKLGRGVYDAGQYRRIAKGGKEIWIQASYNPILDMSGKPFKVVKYATDITEAKLVAANFEGQLIAVSKVQAIIEFTLDGKILTANDNFCTTLGYSLGEIKGQHHSLFVDNETRQSAAYRQFWEKLGRGEHDAGQYRRIGKGGKEVWIQASYNPILDMNGRPIKVVEYATELPEQVRGAGDMACLLDALAQGDLTKTITTEYHGEFRRMRDNANATIKNLSDIVLRISDATDTINDAAAEIATGNAELSQRTEEQGASLEETASSMEEITSTVKQNAENAKQANELTIDACQVAVRGGQVMTQVVDTMASIHQASKKIADIISVIDGIAFQTNILALNAAVEAARAGEQGRGFAVVATEVRNLAQRSAAAAKEIKTLINDSVEKVGTGTKLVDEAGKTIGEVVSSVKRVTQIMGEISAASFEQSSGIEQVNLAITQMDHVTQQNAALVEQAASAAESLQDQVNELSEAVSMFTLDETLQQAAPAPRTRLAPAPRVAERRGPDRAANVARLPAAFERRGVKPASTPSALRQRRAAGGADEWTDF